MNEHHGRALGAALYARAASGEPIAATAELAAQPKTAVQHCIGKPWRIAGVYYDWGSSGESLDRPGLRRLLRDGREGRFDLVVVRELKDLSELWFNSLLIGIQLEERGIRLERAEEPAGPIRLPS